MLSQISFTTNFIMEKWTIKTLYLTLFALILGTHIPSVTSADDMPEVDSSFGKIQGSELTAKNGQTYVGFRGIPFALPPVGDRRFKKPVEHPKLDGVFNGTKPAAAGIRPFAQDGQEDSLVLNIFMKNNQTTTPRKVMIFIFGGGFFTGSIGEYEVGSMVTEQDIILVLPNYRLGIMGFLSTEDENAPGNWGLWDQLMAIRWVKTHIASFGGDPDDITISGESAGAMSVGLQCLSPYGKGLFSKAYLQSGAASSAIRTYYTKPQLDAVELGRHFNCFEREYSYDGERLTLEESEKLLECLRAVPEQQFAKYNIFRPDRTQFLPRVDKDFIPDVPRNLLQYDSYLDSIGFFDRKYFVAINNNEKSGTAQLVGITKNQIYSNPDMTEEQKEAAFNGIVQNQRNLRVASALNEDPANASIDLIVDFYQSRLLNYDAEINIIADVNFFTAPFEFLDVAAKRKETKAWFLYFNHFPRFQKSTNNRGMDHGTDLAFWPDSNTLTLDETDLSVRKMFSSIIANFVKTGDLTHVTETFETDTPAWPTYDFDNQHYLDFGPRPRVRMALMADKYNLWFNVASDWGRVVRIDRPSKKDDDHRGSASNVNLGFSVAFAAAGTSLINHL